MLPIWKTGYIFHQCQLEIASTLGQQGFEVVPLRWIVERTFSWLGWFRRLTMDYERYPKTANYDLHRFHLLDAKPNQMTFQTGS